MVAHSHVDFPSDLATMLTAAGAVVVYCDTSGVRTSADLPVFFATAFGAPILLYELHIPCAPGNVARACSGAGGRKSFYGGIASGVKRLGACLRSCGDANSILQTFKVMPRSAPVRLCGYPWGSPQRGFCHLREAPRIVPFRRRAAYPQALAVPAQMWASPFFGHVTLYSRSRSAPALIRSNPPRCESRSLLLRHANAHAAVNAGFYVEVRAQPRQKPHLPAYCALPDCFGDRRRDRAVRSRPVMCHFGRACAAGDVVTGARDHQVDASRDGQSGPARRDRYRPPPRSRSLSPARPSRSSPALSA